MSHFMKILRLGYAISNSRTFEVLTYKAWAYFLLFTGLVMPFGQHRWCLKRVFDEWGAGWLLFPVCAAIALFSYYQFGNKWAICPYWILWIIDALFIPTLTLRGEK